MTDQQNPDPIMVAGVSASLLLSNIDISIGLAAKIGLNQPSLKEKSR
jgi:hypothetical protein